jgi:hypothetical protein
MSNSLEIAQQLIEQIKGQSDLLLSLSTALIAGATGLLMQLKYKDAADTGLVINKFVWAGFGLLLASCVAAYLTVAALLDKTPLIMSIEYDGTVFGKIDRINAHTSLIYAPSAQFWTFLVGALILVIGIFKTVRRS